MSRIPAALITACLAAAVVAPVRAQDSLSAALALETFDAAWRIVYETHFDTTFNGVDWVGLRDELRPQVEGLTDRAELRRILRDMLDRLGQSHFALIPKEAADTLDPAEGDVSDAVGDLGFDMRLVGDRLLVISVDPAGPAAEAGVRPGWTVTAVNDDQVADLVTALGKIESRLDLGILVWARVQSRVQGEPGTDCRVTFQDGDDRTVPLTLTRRPFPNEPVKIGNLPTFFVRFSQRQVPLAEGAGRAGIVWFNYWMVPLMRQVDTAIDEFRELDGIVIDLRGNGGGVLGMIMGMAGHFLDEPASLGTMKTRRTDLHIRANPRRVSTTGTVVAPYAGPVAILTDQLSGSASEVFAGGMQSIDRVRVFGDTSIGAVLPASMDRLPNEDVLYHAFGEFETATGVRLEGRGVYPDEPVPLARKDLLAGRDAALLAALQWIATEQRDRPAR
jgi:carboxyl-terminal processing protease